MLSLTHIRTFQTATAALSDAARAELAALPVEKQYAYFHQVFSEAKLENVDKLAGAFLVFYRVVAKGLVSANSAEHYALRDTYCPVNTEWHKPAAPVDGIDFIDQDRAVSWLPELDAMPKIAATLDFAEARFGDKLACTVRNYFNLGGYEDLLDARAIGETNPTMKLFIEMVRRKLPAVSPHWFDKGVMLEKVADTRPVAVIRAEAESVMRAQKAKDRAEKQAKAREDAKKAWEVSKIPNLVKLVTAAGGQDAVYKEADCLMALGFEAAATLVRGDYTIPMELAAIANTAAGLSAIPTEAELPVMANIHRVAREAVLMRLAELKPLWLEPNADSDLKFRRSESAPVVRENKPGHFTRMGGAILRSFYRVVEQYGSDAVLAVLKEQLQGKNNQGLDAKLVNELFAAVEFKATPEGLWLKGKDEATAAAEPETLTVAAEAKTNG